MTSPNIFEQGLRRYLSEAQLRVIQSQRVGIGGAGGLGSNLAVMLTRSGFKHFEILDQDTIDPSNLNRQYYFLEDLNQPKVAVLKERLLKINPDLTVTAHQVPWRSADGARYFERCDFVAEAFDQAVWKKEFVEFYALTAPVVVSGNGMAGILVGKPMQLRKVGNIYLVGDHSTEVGQGRPPMAPRVTACAALMAEVILDLTLQKTSPGKSLL